MKKILIILVALFSFFIIYQTFPMVFNEFILFSNTILIHIRLLNSRKQEFWVEICVVT